MNASKSVSGRRYHASLQELATLLQFDIHLVCMYNIKNFFMHESLLIETKQEIPLKHDYLSTRKIYCATLHVENRHCVFGRNRVPLQQHTGWR